MVNSVGLKVFITDFYKDLFHQSKDARLHIPVDLDFPKLSEDDVKELCKLVTPSEIEAVVLESDKAPRPDGFNGHFYKYNWELVKNDIVKVVLSFFESGRMLKEFNRTFITLIPKLENSSRIKDFRPISLCNFLFKIISKVLVKRLSYVLPRLISENQFAFIKGRGLLEAVLLANDMMNDIKHNNLMCVKIDITKAYDSLSWEYLFDVL